MCVTLHEASLGLTMVAGWRDISLNMHCFAYGNQPANRAPGGIPNIMILHVPVRKGTRLTRQNFVPTAGLRHILDDMWDAAPKYRDLHAERGLMSGRLTRGGFIDVFDAGAYSWVAATEADDDAIAAALAGVRLDRRPDITPELRDLIAAYRATWPDDALALGCFSTTGGEPTEPVVITYEPQDWNILRIPATDGHGTGLRFGVNVTVNHRIIVGTTEFGRGGAVSYREAHRMDSRLALTLPRLVVAAELPGALFPNGDFYINFSDIDSAWRQYSRTADFYRADGPRLTDRASTIPMLLG